MGLIEMTFETMFVFMAHPTILAFGETLDLMGELQLLLVIGREPNCEDEIVNEVRAFPLNHAPRCCFWNRSRAQLARIGGAVTPHHFKMLRRERKACPIIYADSLGICIPYADPQRDARRTEWANFQENVVAHIANIFSHQPIINRVALVIMSGLNQAVFATAIASIVQHCEELNIPYQSIGFFGGRGPNNQLDHPLTPRSRGCLNEIYKSFLQLENE